MGTRARRRHHGRARDRSRVRGLRHARDREGARRRAHARGPVRPRARRAATRSTPTPARSAPSSPSCSTCRSSPACATSRSTATASTRGASTTTAGCRPRCELPAILSTRRTPHRPGEGRPAGRARGARADCIRTVCRRRPRRRVRGAGRVADVGRAGEGHGRRPRPAPLARRAARRAGRRGGAVPRRHAARSTPTATDELADDRSRVSRRESPCTVVVARARPRALRTASCSARPRSSPATCSRSRVASTRRPRSSSAGARTRSCTSPARTSRKTSRARSPISRADEPPWAILAPSTAWGREVASRVAARLDAGLTGDAVDLEPRRRPARRVEAGVRRPARRRDRLHVAGADGDRPRRACSRRSRRAPRRDDRVRDDRARPHAVACRVLARTRDDDLDVLAEAHTVIGVGTRRRPRRVPRARTAAHRCSAPSSARRARSPTRAGSPAPARSASPAARSRPACSSASARAASSTTRSACAPRGTVLAINPDPDAPIFEHADVGIVGDWHDALPLLVEQLRARNA